MGDGWVWRYSGFDADGEGLREALCAVGNGYLVTRGAMPEAVADGVHYPGTYLAGCYHRAVSQVADREVVNEDLVNCPNWLPFSFRAAEPDAGPWFGTDGFLAQQQELELDLRHGILTRRRRCVDAQGRVTDLEQRVFAHLGRRHLAVLESTLTPRGWSGLLEVRSGLDGQVENSGVARYRDLNRRHLVPVGQGSAAEDTVWLQVGAPDAALRVAMAARTRLRSADGSDVPMRQRQHWAPGLAEQVLTLAVGDGRPVTVEKVVAVCSSRDNTVLDPAQAVRRFAAAAPDSGSLRREQELRWRELWRRCRMSVEFADDSGGPPGDPAHPDRLDADAATGQPAADSTPQAPASGPAPNGLSATLRLYTFHLLQTYSEHSADLDVSIPARGLHGEAYRGHVFWDELFILPFLNLHLPELSRSSLKFRFRRLGEARRAAHEGGYRGAMYPWQSGIDGREETQQLHLNPRSGRWLPDHSHLQRHVGSAVAYNVWHYYQATGDVDFLTGYGAEMLLEIARFWSSLAEFDPVSERYRLRGVVGPDEYHEAYPWSERPGLDDNAYTNVLASWVLARARDALAALPGYRRAELTERLEIEPGELERWHDLEQRIHVPFHDGVISQFDQYQRLEELDWAGYRAKYGDIRRLDRILEAEGDSVNRYRASKQADVLMLWYLFPPEEVDRLLRRLGHRPDPDLMRRTVDYYRRRTSHGSTLSSVVHAWVLSRLDPRAAWRFFREAVASDAHDVQGGTTAEGIHLGAMTGSVDLVQRCFTGLAAERDLLRFDPALPEQLLRLRLNLRYQGRWGLTAELTGDRTRVTVPQDATGAARGGPVRVAIGSAEYRVAPGGSAERTERAGRAGRGERAEAAGADGVAGAAGAVDGHRVGGTRLSGTRLDGTPIDGAPQDGAQRDGAEQQGSAAE